MLKMSEYRASAVVTSVLGGSGLWTRLRVTEMR